jgi:hypothetical protein
MNVIRELKVNGMIVQEVERHGEFFVFVNGYQVIEDYATTIKLIGEHGQKESDEMKRVRELYAEAKTRIA